MKKIKGAYIGGCDGADYFFTTKETGDIKLKLKANTELVQKQLQEILEVPIRGLAFCNQKHGNQIKIVTADNFSQTEDVDAMITKENKICLAIVVADCVPIILCDRKKHLIAAVHAGWRGTVTHITRKAIGLMVEKFDSNPKDVWAVIGPSISPRCYVVGEETIVAANNAGFADCISERSGDTYFDLWKANEKQLLEMGIPLKNIENSEICTHCNHDFFSYRRDNTAQRFVVGAMLNSFDLLVSKNS